jgi:hypothetical protein
MSRYSDPLQLSLVAKWCQTNCRNDWRITYPYDWDTKVLFEDEQDAVTFALTWS